MNYLINICFAFIGIMNCIAQTSFYDLKAETIDGEEFNFSMLKGKKVLIVNTASKCGYTPQYKDLEEIYNQYHEQYGVEIIGFPSNDFMKQEPGSNEEIALFCEKNYGVTFQMMAKVNVKGNEINPVYDWLTSKEKNGKLDSKVKWNFQKYLISETGELIDVVDPGESPSDKTITNWITK